MRSRAWASPSTDRTKVSPAAAPRSSGLCSAIQTPTSTTAVPTTRFQLSGSSTNATPSRTKGTYLNAQYHRLRGRRGPGKATMAVAHSVLVIADHALDQGVPYQELGD